MKPPPSSTRRGEPLCIPGGPLKTNAYILETEQPGSCVVIDAGFQHAQIESTLVVRGLSPLAVLCTHGHFDHIAGAAHLQRRHGIPVYLASDDLRLAKMANFMLAAFKLEQRIELPAFHLLSEPDTVLCIGGVELTFMTMPGHTPGSVAIVSEGLLFSGDSLYARTTALSRLPGEDHALLRRSLKRLFAHAHGETLVLPGHGAHALLDDIRSHNAALRAFLDAA